MQAARPALADLYDPWHSLLCISLRPQEPSSKSVCLGSGLRVEERLRGSLRRMASSPRPPVCLSTVTLLVSLSLSSTCLAQIAPAASPLQTQVASTPVFAGQRPNTTVSAVAQNAIITARPSFLVSPAPTLLAV